MRTCAGCCGVVMVSLLPRKDVGYQPGVCAGGAVTTGAGAAGGAVTTGGGAAGAVAGAFGAGEAGGADVTGGVGAVSFGAVGAAIDGAASCVAG